MTEAREKGDRPERASENQMLKSADAQEARVAGASDIKAAHALNRNAHSGSAGGENQEHSIELVMPRKDGSIDVLAARVMPQETSKAEQLLTKVSDWQDQLDTGSIIAAEVRKNPAAEPVSLLNSWAKNLPEGSEKQAYRQLAREQLVEMSPKAKEKLDVLDQRRRMIDANEQEDAGVHDMRERQPKAMTGYVEYPDSHKENEWKVFTRLPQEERRAVIEALMKCPEAISTDYNKQLEAITRAFPKGIENFATHTFEAVVGLGQSFAKVCQFAEDVKSQNPRALETAFEAYRVMGRAAVTGHNIWSMGTLYISDMNSAAARGDAGKVFRDIGWLGTQIDQQWGKKSEAEKVEIATEFAAGLAIPGGIASIAKSEKLTVALMQIAKLVPEEQLGKYVEAWQCLGKKGLGKVFDPKLVAQTSEGSQASDFYMAMSKADDLSGGGKVGRSLLLGRDGALVKVEKLKHLIVSETIGDVRDSNWKGANFLTGWKVESSLKAKFMAAGEALPNNFPAVDGWSFKQGLVTSIKSIELRAPSYQDMEHFEKRVKGYVQELSDWKGDMFSSTRYKINPRDVKDKVLHLGIPDGAISSEQRNMLEKIAKELEKNGSDVKIKVTALR